MVAQRFSDDVLIAVWKDNNHGVRATARALGVSKSAVQQRLNRMIRDGDHRVNPMDKVAGSSIMGGKAGKIQRARMELELRSERKQDKGDWRDVSRIRLNDGPSILGIFGDPHMDNPGFQMDIFEENLFRRNPDENIHTCCVGDFFDNWPRAMGHLYKETGDPAPAWTMFEHWMDEAPFLFAVTGNHDQFGEATVEFLPLFFRDRDTELRRSGGHFALDMGGGEPVVIAMRHIWQGNSQYSEAHPEKRAAAFGHTDADVIAGGHTHKGDLRQHVRPFDGRVQRLVHVSSFKKFDNYANDKGFISAETPPVVWLVLDDREPKNSHNRAQAFYDFNVARAVQIHMRQKNG